MEFEREFLISSSFSEETTGYKCPFCGKGFLVLFQNKFLLQEYQSTKRKLDFLDLDPLEIKSTCSGILQCNCGYCNEFVSFCGEARGDQIEFENNDVPGGSEIANVERIKIRYIHPSPRLIEIREQYPGSIKRLLKDSFSLYWSNPSSCANKIRIIVEEVLNNLSIPKKHKKTKKKKFILSTLHHRLGRLKEKKKYEEAAEYLFAIKWIANPASHADIFNEESVINGYKLLDKALDLIYVGSDRQLKKLRDEINKNKKHNN